MPCFVCAFVFISALVTPNGERSFKRDVMKFLNLEFFSI